MRFPVFLKCPQPTNGCLVFNGDGCPAFKMILSVYLNNISLLFVRNYPIT